MTVKTALIVEDDKPLQALLQEACDAAGLHVIAAADGEAAVQALQRKLPDVVLCDLLLPGISGFDVLQQLRAMPGGGAVPAYVMSGIYRGQKHRQQALETLGCRAWFAKPVRVAELVAALCQATGVRPPSPPSMVPKPRGSAPTQQPFRDPLADGHALRERRSVEAVVVPPAVAQPSPTSVWRGHLQQTPFGTVLAQLRRERRTGALLLRRERVKKIVDVVDGMPVFVKSNLLSECLGRVLVKERLLSLADCERSVELQAVMRKPQGELLIEMGLLTSHQLAQGLRLQLQHKLFDVFAWDVGDYELLSPVPAPDQSVALDMTVATIVYEGLRQAVPEARLQALVEPLLSRCLSPSSQPWSSLSELALDAGERMALSRLDGRLTTAAFLDQSGLPRLQTMQLVCAVTQARLYDVHDATQDTVEVRSVRPPARPQRAPKPTEPSVDDVKEVRARLHAMAKRMRKADPFAVLGVSRRSSSSELTRAHHSQHRALDHQQAITADVRALAHQLQGLLDAALDAIQDEGKREEWLRRHQRSSAPDDAPRRLLRAEVLAKRGETALTAGRHDEAIRSFSEAVAMQPNDGDLVSWLGLAMWSQQPDDTLIEAEAMARLEQAVELSPKRFRPWLHLGRAHARARRDSQAVAAYQRVVNLHPENREAADFVERNTRKSEAHRGR